MFKIIGFDKTENVITMYFLKYLIFMYYQNS